MSDAGRGQDTGDNIPKVTSPEVEELVKGISEDEQKMLKLYSSQRKLKEVQIEKKTTTLNESLEKLPDFKNDLLDIPPVASAMQIWDLQDDLILGLENERDTYKMLLIRYVNLLKKEREEVKILKEEIEGAIKEETETHRIEEAEGNLDKKRQSNKLTDEQWVHCEGDFRRGDLPVNLSKKYDVSNKTITSHMKSKGIGSERDGIGSEKIENPIMRTERDGIGSEKIENSIMRTESKKSQLETRTKNINKEEIQSHNDYKDKAKNEDIPINEVNSDSHSTN